MKKTIMSNLVIREVYSPAYRVVDPIGYSDREIACFKNKEDAREFIKMINGERSTEGWVSVKDRLPPEPSTPYKQYLVWATTEENVRRVLTEIDCPFGFGYAGVPGITQFRKIDRQFLPIRGWEELVIVYWAEILVPESAK